jgi:hypothetical protein
VHLRTLHRQRFVLTAIFGLLVWLFAVAGHVHAADRDDERAPTATHSCLLCAAVQPAAPPPALPSVELREVILSVDIERRISLVSEPARSPYLSRGPPHS